MTTTAIVTTIAAGFIFPFVLSFVWGRIAGQGKTIGILVCGAFIIGMGWLLNHGAGAIVQGENAPWVDQAWAVGIGLIANGIYNKGSFKKSVPTLFASIAGGVLGGFILSCLP